MMRLEFTNRVAELKELGAAAQAGGLLVVFGRRRVGKTRLLVHWLEPRGGFYSQAIEGVKAIQLDQVFQDIQGWLKASVVPKTWAELFEVVSLQEEPLGLLPRLQAGASRHGIVQSVCHGGRGSACSRRTARAGATTRQRRRPGCFTTTPPLSLRTFAAVAIRRQPGIGNGVWNLILCGWRSRGAWS